MAAEFHVLSTLHRLGFEANLTLGNKKSVDIVMTNRSGDVVTIDVKGIAKKYDWPADNIKEPTGNKHFIVLVSYEGKIQDPTVMPKVWVIPYEQIQLFEKRYRTRVNIARTLVLTKGERFLNAWHLLADAE